MRKPQDPRHHGLHEPKKVHTRKEGLTLTTQGNKLSLEAIVGAWNKALRDHLSQGHRITDGPFVNGDNYRLVLTYDYEWDNLNYSVEKAEYDAAISAYETDLAKFKAQEEEIKINPPNLDQKIERAKQRLANLEAAKAGQPIPHPEG